MEIKHMHPVPQSADERTAALKDIRRTCIALIVAQQKRVWKGKS